jgi:hypothetical protein
MPPKSVSVKYIFLSTRRVMAAAEAAKVIHAKVSPPGAASAAMTPAHNGTTSLRKGISLKSTDLQR